MMDRNTLIGFVLIGAILIGATMYNSPSQEQIQQRKRIQDSIAAVKKLDEKQRAQETIAREIIRQTSDSLPSDSLQEVQQLAAYGPFAPAARGEDGFVYLQNDLIKLSVSKRGGHIAAVELLKFKTWQKNPLFLADADSSRFGLGLISENKIINTDTLYFIPHGDIKISANKRSLTMRMPARNGKYLDYTYTLSDGSYMVDFALTMNGLNEFIPANLSNLNMYWDMQALRHEKNLEAEQNASTIYYKYQDDETDYLSETSDDAETLQGNLKWLGFKQQFFASALYSKTGLEKPVDIKVRKINNSQQHTKMMSAVLSLPYAHKQIEKHEFGFYFGPNHFQTLKSYGLGLEEMIPLGWGILGWINRFCVIPIFNFFESLNLGYGLIILILTIVIKLVLLPLTYKAYLSTAKMKVLKPEMDEINLKFSNDDPMKKQQAIMGLYRKAGVNPLGGCLPMLLQLPILFAMFRFFPASIELRQKSFLWADDLSTYDSIYDLPFHIPGYGDHVSLFTLLMTVSTIMYTRMNSSQFSGPQMAQMKWVMYLMPVIFLGVLNNYSSGLSYYYFLANMITFGQQFLIRKFVDEEAIHRKIQENKKKPVTKSKFQERLEAMQKQQKMLQQQRQQQQKGKKR
jgi:YidC/Oxa1 family membrane protein insertase